MSSQIFSRILSKFLHIQQRLESLLNLCRISENPSWNDENEGGEFDHFCGPYRADIEELENSLSTLSMFIETLRNEIHSTDDPTLPLCKNEWTMEKIDDLERQMTDEVNLDVLAMLRLQFLAESFQQINDDDQHDERNSEDQWENIVSSIVRTENQKLFLDDLPSEILLHIFSFLKREEWLNSVAPTCRHFAQLVLQHVYSHLNLTRAIPVDDVCQIFRHLSALKSITFFDWEDDLSLLTWAIWFDLIQQKQIQLRTIRFRNVSLCPILICLIVEYFGDSLTNLIFDYQQGKTYEKFDLIFCLLADRSIRVERLTASYQLGITNFGLKRFVSELSKLIELNLVYVEAINDETVKTLCDKHQSWLEILRIDGAQLTDQAIDSISQCVQLQSLMIEFCTNLTGTNFSHFQKFSNLRQLSLSKLNNVSTEFFQNLFNTKDIFPHMILLKLGECHLFDDSCLQSIIKACPNLIDFTCTWAYAVTTIGFNEIVQHFHQLKSLSLIGCYQISGEILFDVPGKYLQSIRIMNFEQCNQIDDDILLDLYRRKKTITITNYYGSIVEDEEDLSS